MNSPLVERSDDELVEICNRGRPDEAARAFETLYLRHRDYVLRVALRFAGDRDLALDALQETFTYLLRKFPPAGTGLRLSARLQTLLYPVAKHCAMDALRKSRRDVDRGGPAPDDLPTEHAEPDDDGVIDKALAGLSPERREVLTLRFVDDLSLAEIARALGVPLGTVKSRLHLALKQLREDRSIADLFDP